jgi:hypothetical protein
VGFALLPFMAPTVQAAKCASEDKLTIISIKPWYSGVCKDGTDEVEITKIPGDIILIVLNLLSIAMQVAGYVAVGFVIWGGIKYVISTGDSGKTAAAKTTIQNALIGLLLVLIAVTMVDFVGNIYK